MDDTITCEWVGDKGLSGYEILIPFHRWTISIYVKDGDDSMAVEDIRIEDSQGREVTDRYMIFKSDAPLRSTGLNLYQTMDLLTTNLSKRRSKNG